MEKNKNVKKTKKVTTNANEQTVKASSKSNITKKFKYGTLRDKLLILLMLILIAGFSMVITLCVYIVASAPKIDNERLYKSNSSVLYDINGNEFARLGVENREKVTYDDLPEVLIDAIVATEDSRYFQHNGIDIARFTKAVIGQLMGHDDAGGGSTLTMQVSKNAATSSTASGIKGIIRKFTDIYLSVFVFEKRYTKEQIMEFYVNIPFLGAHSYGVEQACQNYFGKSVSELNLVEAATIAGLFQAPSSYDPFAHPVAAQRRRDTVLNLMYRHGYITEEERDSAKKVPVESLLIEQNSTKNKYQGFIDTVVSEVINRTKTKTNKNGDDPYKVSMNIYTTMDPERQDVVNDIFNGVTYTWKNDVVQSGVAVISVKDGSIVAVGNGRNMPERGMNYATNARRHPGSTAKPILDYGPAIEYLGWGTGTTVIDEEMTYSSGAKIKNFDNGYKGIMMVKTALAQSRNIPALYTFQQTTNEQKLEFATNLGWRPETDNRGENLKAESPTDIKGNVLETCSIGGFNGVTPLESAAAFATFGRGGTYIEPFSFTKLEYTESGDILTVNPKKVQAMSEETAYMISVILKYAVTSGSVGAGSVSGTDIAAKTGTSTVDSTAKKNAGIKASIIGDSWEVAYSPDYAISTWYGYPNQLDKDHYLTSKEGGTARKEITKKLVVGIMKKNSKFKKPSGVVAANIELETDPIQLASDYTPENLKATEYFKKGTQPTSVSERFDKLTNASNLTYSSGPNTVTLKWKEAPIPNAISEEWLRNYFSESKLYSKFGDKFLTNRINYNNSTFGQFGYQIYMTNANGTVDLGFTTNTTYTTNVSFDSQTTFTVKSAYQNFKANMSNGITVSVQPNIQEKVEDVQQQTTPITSFSVEYVGPSCTTLSDFNNLGTSPKNKIRVTANGENVTDKASITNSCSYMDEEIDCNSLEEGKDYSILFTIKYNNEVRNKKITIKSSC